MAKEERLSREVHEDGKGLYCFYGLYRLRPPTDTQFKKGEIVSISSFFRVFGVFEVATTDSSGAIEIWQIRDASVAEYIECLVKRGEEEKIRNLRI